MSLIPAAREYRNGDSETKGIYLGGVSIDNIPAIDAVPASIYSLIRQTTVPSEVHIGI